MDLPGLLNKLVVSAEYIDRGRKGFTIDGEEHNGRINYEKGIFGALDAFQEARLAADPNDIIPAEIVFLQQELHFCNEADNNTIGSLTQAIESFNDALRAIKAVDSGHYETAEATYPQNGKYRYRQMPRDAVHIACIAHRTRIQNILRVPGMNMTEKAVYEQRAANMGAAQTAYLEKQKSALSR